jgi:hypothetical protein
LNNSYDLAPNLPQSCLDPFHFPLIAPKLSSQPPPPPQVLQRSSSSASSGSPPRVPAPVVLPVGQLRRASPADHGFWKFRPSCSGGQLLRDAAGGSCSGVEQCSGCPPRRPAPVCTMLRPVAASAVRCSGLAPAASPVVEMGS